MSGRNRLRDDRKKIKKALPAIVITVIALAAAGIFLSGQDKKTIEHAPEEDPEVLIVGGKEVERKNNLLSYLFIGVDAPGTVEEINALEDGGGQCDVLELLVIDKEANTFALVPIDRNTITEVDSLDEDDNYSVIASTEVQISLAHAHGDGREISCENTVHAVSNLLYGQKIDGYLAINYNAVQIINHDLGGVTVTVEDDLTALDEALAPGVTVKLSDEQALDFVQGRMTVADGTNINRMGRQQAYINSAREILREKSRKNVDFPLTVYDDLADYMVTDITRSDISKIAKAVLNNKDLGTFTIEGEDTYDEDGYAALIPSRESLDEIALALFYDEQ